MKAESSEQDLFREYSVTLDEPMPDFEKKRVSLYAYIKTALDFFSALIGLIVSSPIILCAAAAIKLESKGPIFFSQQRVGMNGRFFKVMKLRSMKFEPLVQSTQWTAKNDPRITRVGAFIRKTRIDELPQLINVLKGDMSLIGPRPETPVLTAQFNEEIPGFVHRLSVKPGLTGWAQVNGGYEVTPEEKFELDRYYIHRLGLKIDVKIVFKTIKVVFTGNGAR